MKLLEGRSAIVTGASRGIGRSIALEYARQGAALVLNASRASDALTETVAEIRDMGGRCESVSGSVVEEVTARALVEKAVAAFGKLDILVNNAGIVRDKPLVMMSEREFDEVLAVNLRGVYQCSREAVRQMMKQRHGRIISISSVAALAGRPGQCNYTAAKAGIVGFTKSLAPRGGQVQRARQRVVRRGDGDRHVQAHAGGGEEGAPTIHSPAAGGATGRGGRPLRFPGLRSVDLRDRHDHQRQWRELRLMTTSLVEAHAYAGRRKDLTHRLKETLVERLDLDRRIDEIPDDCLLFGVGLGLDSVDALEIVVAVESEFGIRVEDDDMKEIRSVNSIVDLILSRRNREEDAR